MADGESAQPRKGPEYYLDLSNGTIIVGRLAVKEYCKSGGDDVNLYSLPELLRDTASKLPSVDYEIKNTREWERKDYLKYGRWLNKVIGKTLTDKSLNEPVLWRARKLGLGPSPRTIAREFGSMSLYYKSLGFIETHRISPFNDWLQEDFVSYIQQVGEEIGGRPTYKVLHARSLENTDNPSPTIIAKRFGGRKLGPVAELAGYPDIYSWRPDDFVNWGVKFMLANDGLVPSSRKINYFSTKGLGPSSRGVIDKFAKLHNYQDLVIEAYQEKLCEQIERTKEKKREIKSALAVGEIPKEIFQGVESDDEKILRYARYVVVDHFFSDSFSATKFSISTMSNPTVQEAGFVRSIRKANDAITAGDIESTALFFGVFDILWPMDEYLERLRIPEEEFVPKSLTNNIRLKKGLLQKATA